jgi:hypothetical protein
MIAEIDVPQDFKDKKMDTNAPASANGCNSGNRVIDIGMIPTKCSPLY